MAETRASNGESHLALAAGVACYVLWGLGPILFLTLNALGVSPLEILAQRAIWVTPAAFAFVIWARQGRQLVAVLRNPRVMLSLTVSAVLIATNWSVFIWAVVAGRVLETSLGYYINPLMSMAAGALLFRERIGAVGWSAVALAAIGVGFQGLALGQPPWISMGLALTGVLYSIVRKRVAADAQTGLLVECLVLLAPALATAAWLQTSGVARFGHGVAPTGWLIAMGLYTAGPLVLFAWSNRRLPLSAMGFLQFISPTMTFAIGALRGETFDLLRAVSFVFIWMGVAVFAWAAWRRGRRIERLQPAVEAGEA